MDQTQYKPEDSLFTPVPASPFTPFSPFHSADPTSLDAWDQVAQGGYLAVAVTFPFCGDKKALEAHLRTSLGLLGRDNQVFAARLRLDPHTGQISIAKQPDDDIPFEVKGHADSLTFTYEQLKDRKFAPSIFVHPDFIADGSLDPFSPVPVSQVRATFIEGGLVLWVYVHQAIANLDILHKYLECFAAATRREKFEMVDHKSSKTVPGTTNSEAESLCYSTKTDAGLTDHDVFEDLLTPSLKHENALSFTKPRQRPEWYTPILGTPAAQTNFHHANTLLRGPQRRSSMFVFNEKRIKQIAILVAAIHPTSRRFSCDVVLAALTWAHVTRARFSTERQDAEDMGLADGPARLLLLNLACTFADAATVEKPVDKVVAVYEDFRAIVGLMNAISDDSSNLLQENISKDETDVATAANAAVCDIDGNKPQHLVFNDWGFLGSNIEWAISVCDEGKTVEPAAIRPVRGGNALGYAHIMPVRVSGGTIEMVLNIPERAMETLLKDEDFMRWVDRVVD